MKYEKLSKEEWHLKVIDLAYTYLAIRECQKCGSPVNNGYCCPFCGDCNPSEKEEEPSQ